MLLQTHSSLRCYLRIFFERTSSAAAVSYTNPLKIEGNLYSLRLINRKDSLAWLTDNALPSLAELGGSSFTENESRRISVRQSQKCDFEMKGDRKTLVWIALPSRGREHRQDRYRRYHQVFQYVQMILMVRNLERAGDYVPGST